MKGEEDEGNTVAAAAPRRAGRLVLIGATLGVPILVAIMDRVFGLASVAARALVLGGIVGLVITLMTRGLVAVLRRVGLTRRTLRPGPVWVSGSLLVAGVLTVVLLQFSAPPAVLDDEVAAPTQLRYMFQTDQQDRIVPRIRTVARRDAARRARVRDLGAAGLIDVPEDHFYAALILHHGTGPRDYAQAHRLATHAAEHGVVRGEWLRRATYDRWQLSLGNDQRYGTQSSFTAEQVAPR